MLAQEANSPFSSAEWTFEVKWDGIRAISYVSGSVDAGLSIRSRNNQELRFKFPELEELKGLVGDAVLDGEIVVMRGGKPDFQALLERSQTSSEEESAMMAKECPANYIVFDLLELDGKPIVDFPLEERRRLLKENVREGKFTIISAAIDREGEAYYEAAVAQGLEGIIAKRMGSAYEEGRRSADWLKIKKVSTCDCAIFGYTVGEGGRSVTFGALILGLYNGGVPVFVGKVGTGFSEDSLSELSLAFKSLKSEVPTLQGVDVKEVVVWLIPGLVCEVAYQGVTKEGKLRMPRFKRIRADKKPLDCSVGQIMGQLASYRSRRDFEKTPEPSGDAGIAKVKKEITGKATYVVHEHHARRLHYDLRLERGGVLKSWAVPKGVPLEKGERRLAIQTEDHPLEYGNFEGTIPKGEYGAGSVSIWDRGAYETLEWKDDKIEVAMEGKKIIGRYALIRFRKAGEGQWLLIRLG